MIAPPPKLPLLTATMDEHPRLRRIQFRLWQIGLSAVIVLVAGWCYTLSPVVGIAATFLAKHVLVGILAAGLDLPDD
jgi:hypothetical protein